jgi:alkylated DNA repair dioxygenase AlkB
MEKTLYPIIPMMNISSDLYRGISRDLSADPSIASLSLGGERDFYLKSKLDGTLVEKYVLQSGDMVLMQGETQSKWLHAIPKRTHAEPRIKYIANALQS